MSQFFGVYFKKNSPENISATLISVTEDLANHLLRNNWNIWGLGYDETLVFSHDPWLSFSDNYDFRS